MILGSVAWSEALSRITASGSVLRGRGRRPSPIRSADDLREILGQAVGSQQRLRGEFRGFGFKVNPRVSHRLKLGHQGRADWRKRQEKGGWSNTKLEHPVEHSRVGSASPSRSGPGPPALDPPQRALGAWTLEAQHNVRFHDAKRAVKQLTKSLVHLSDDPAKAWNLGTQALFPNVDILTHRAFRDEQIRSLGSQARSSIAVEAKRAHKLFQGHLETCAVQMNQRLRRQNGEEEAASKNTESWTRHIFPRQHQSAQWHSDRSPHRRNYMIFKVSGQAKLTNCGDRVSWERAWVLAGGAMANCRCLDRSTSQLTESNIRSLLASLQPALHQISTRPRVALEAAIVGDRLHRFSVECLICCPALKPWKEATTASTNLPSLLKTVRILPLSP
ncbi:hypothetical protein LA080_013512 [Diaporthe eres]|nr:hypothetical protein LA080_013512 [Diaporthe eres]